MHDTSARQVERVLPAASYRQWVLAVPFPLRLRIARDPGELSRVLKRPLEIEEARYLPGAGAHRLDRALPRLLDGARLLPVVDLKLEPGAAFTFKTQPLPGWDGTVNCRFLEIEAQRKLSYTWVVGDMDTVVTSRASSRTRSRTSPVRATAGR